MVSFQRGLCVFCRQQPQHHHQIQTQPPPNGQQKRYGHEQGYASYRAALAAFLSSRHSGCSGGSGGGGDSTANAAAAAASAAVDPDDLLVTAGVSHGIDLCCRRLASPGDAILVERPTYFLLAPILEQNGLRAVYVPTDDEGLDVGALRRMLEAGDGAGAR